MRKIFSILCIIVFLQGNTLHAQENFSKKLRHISWIIGTWKRTLPEGNLFERWQWVNDSTCSGQSWLITSGGDSLPQESVQFVSRSGNIYFIPTLLSKKKGGSLAFRVTSFSSRKFQAENQEIDFPQKITYLLVSKDRLEATMEGIRGGQESKEVFPMNKLDPH
jgi:hypothetical protein